MYVGTQRRGLGANPAQVVGMVSSVGTPVATAGIASALSTTTAAGATTILGMAPALAVPIIGAALAGITFAAIKLIQNSGCGPTCIQASAYADQAEPLLRQNIQEYFALPIPRPATAQRAALGNYDALWAKLVQLWNDPALGNAGKRGISDRQAGACKWHATADSPWPGGPAAGACWNWANAYRDPIANDPNVVPDAQANLPGSFGSLVSGSGGVSLGGLALIAGLVLAGVYLS